MKDKPTNRPASVGARLRNLARERGMNLELILRRYVLERRLLRLSLSPHRDRFILKGAMLFTAWLSGPFRPTQDLDLLGFGDTDVQSIAVTGRDPSLRSSSVLIGSDNLNFHSGKAQSYRWLGKGSPT